jgi:putative transposase
MQFPGYPLHVTQRGHNKQNVFFETEDYYYYLRLIHQYSLKYKLEVHAYVLMSNHVHLLLSEGAGNCLSSMMRVLGSCYTNFINKKYGRKGSLWGNRHHVSPIGSEKYFFICHQYIELNPVRAAMVGMPVDYLWSSYHFNADGKPDWISEHELYRKLGNSKEERCAAYKELFPELLSGQILREIRNASNKNLPLGRLELRGRS